MEVLLLILFFVLIIFIFALFIWNIVLQIKISDISHIVKQLSIDLKTLKEKLENSRQTQQPATNIAQKIVNEIQNQVPMNKKAIPAVSTEINNNHESHSEIKYTQIHEHTIYNSNRDSYGQGFDFQKAFFENVFNKIGALAIIIATIIFISIERRAVYAIAYN